VSAVGIFAGRGDVLVAMALALIIGVWIGWQCRKLFERLKRQANF
jgi:hypothetical protein